MRKHVLFLMMMAVLSFPLHANPSPTWTDYAATLEPSCATPSTPMDVLRCNEARAQFCGTTGNRNCTLDTVANATTVDDIRTQLIEAAQRCRSAANDAQRQCFDNLGQRDAPVAQTTLQQMCDQSQQLNARAERANTEAGGRCQGVKGRCQTSCTAALDQLNRMINGCPACTRLRNSPHFRVLSEKGPWCNSILPGIALEQAQANLNAGNIAERCRQLTAGTPPGGVGGGNSNPSGGRERASAGSGGGSGLSPQMMMGLAQAAMALMNQPQPQQQPQSMMNPSLDPVDCGVNPTLAGCPTQGAAGSDSWNTKTAALESASSAGSSGGFNPADDNAMAPAAADGNAAAQAAGAPQQMVGAVPNNGGPMVGGAGGPPASLGGGAGAGGAAGRTNTDVLQGFGGAGGGMGAMAANMNMKNGESGGGYSYGQGGYGQDEQGLDLSQFLPGGKQDPTRKLAGISESANFQIQSKDVNIWSRISERIKARCSQGLLRDCIP